MQLLCKLTNGLVIWDDDGDTIVKDDEGKIVATSKYDALSDVMYAVDVGDYYFASINDKFTILNSNGKELNDFLYDNVKEFVHGFAAVAREGKWTFVNGKGHEITDLIYDNIGNFENHYAWVKRDGKTVFINEEGQEIYEIPSVYLSAKIIPNTNYAVVSKKPVAGVGIVNLLTGEEVIEPRYIDFLSFAPTKNHFFMSNHDGCVMFDEEGVLIKTIYNIGHVGKFNNGYAPFSVIHKMKSKILNASEGEYGYIDEYGTIVLAPVYYYASEVDDEGNITVRFPTGQSLKKNIAEEILKLANTKHHKL
ncbi:MAG: WG repeat-containing protein [Clostridia bacterium]|nr:WG repeat-containing protein [Clostridia bacterium]